MTVSLSLEAVPLGLAGDALQHLSCSFCLAWPAGRLALCLQLAVVQKGIRETLVSGWLLSSVIWVSRRADYCCKVSLELFYFFLNIHSQLILDTQP